MDGPLKKNNFFVCGFPKSLFFLSSLWLAQSRSEYKAWYSRGWFQLWASYRATYIHTSLLRPNQTIHTEPHSGTKDYSFNNKIVLARTVFMRAFPQWTFNLLHTNSWIYKLDELQILYLLSICKLYVLLSKSFKYSFHQIFYKCKQYIVLVVTM